MTFTHTWDESHLRLLVKYYTTPLTRKISTPHLIIVHTTSRIEITLSTRFHHTLQNTNHCIPILTLSLHENALFIDQTLR